MAANGSERTTARNIKSLFSRGAFLQWLRKNMGLGDTLGPLPPENGGTGMLQNGMPCSVSVSGASVTVTLPAGKTLADARFVWFGLLGWTTDSYTGKGAPVIISTAHILNRGSLMVYGGGFQNQETLMKFVAEPTTNNSSFILRMSASSDNYLAKADSAYLI